MQGLEAFKVDMKELLVDKLAKSPAQTFWRLNSPAHFGGHTGTYTGIQELLVCPGPCLINMRHDPVLDIHTEQSSISTCDSTIAVRCHASLLPAKKVCCDAMHGYCGSMNQHDERLAVLSWIVMMPSLLIWWTIGHL